MDQIFNHISACYQTLNQPDQNRVAQAGHQNGFFVHSQFQYPTSGAMFGNNGAVIYPPFIPNYQNYCFPSTGSLPLPPPIGLYYSGGSSNANHNGLVSFETPLGTNLGHASFPNGIPTTHPHNVFCAGMTPPAIGHGGVPFPGMSCRVQVPDGGVVTPNPSLLNSSVQSYRPTGPTTDSPYESCPRVNGILPSHIDLNRASSLMSEVTNLSRDGRGSGPSQSHDSGGSAPGATPAPRRDGPTDTPAPSTGGYATSLDARDNGSALGAPGRGSGPSQSHDSGGSAPGATPAPRRDGPTDTPAPSTGGYATSLDARDNGSALGAPENNSTPGGNVLNDGRGSEGSQSHNSECSMPGATSAGAASVPRRNDTPGQPTGGNATLRSPVRDNGLTHGAASAPRPNGQNDTQRQWASGNGTSRDYGPNETQSPWAGGNATSWASVHDNGYTPGTTSAPRQNGPNETPRSSVSSNATQWVRARINGSVPGSTSFPSRNGPTGNDPMTFEPVACLKKWVPLDPPLISNTKEGALPLINLVFGRYNHNNTHGGGQSNYFYRYCGEGRGGRCPFKIRCQQMPDNTWQLFRHATECLHEFHHAELDPNGDLRAYDQTTAFHVLSKKGPMPERIREFVEAYRFTNTNIGMIKHNAKGPLAILQELRLIEEYRDSAFHMYPEIEEMLKKKIANHLKNLPRQVGYNKDANTFSLTYKLPENTGELTQDELAHFLQENSWNGEDVIPHSDINTIDEYLTHLKVDRKKLKDIIFLPCPSREDLEKHMRDHGTEGSPERISNDDYSVCKSCACFTSLLQLFGTYRAKRTMKRTVRMTDGTYGVLGDNDKDVCLIITGLIGTHQKRARRITRRIWVDGYVLCGKGESGWPILVLTVAVKKILERIFGESNAWKPDVICIDNAAGLTKGYKMSQKCMTNVPLSTQESLAAGAATILIWCLFHRQQILKKQQRKYFPQEWMRPLIRQVIIAQRRMHDSPTLEFGKGAKEHFIAEWRNLGLEPCARLFTQSSGNDTPFGQMHYGAAGFPGFPSENGAIESIHGVHKNYASIETSITRQQFLNTNAQKIVFVDGGLFTCTGPSLYVIPDDGNALERGYSPSIVGVYFLMCGEGPCIDSKLIPPDHLLFQAIEIFYPHFGTGVEKAWLTNKPRYSRKPITDQDLTMYLYVLQNSTGPSRRFLDLEKVKNRFCLTWLNPRQPLHKKKYYCNCDIFAQRCHCPSTLLNMDLEHVHGWQLHRFLEPVKPRTTVFQIHINQSRSSEVCQIPPFRIQHFLWNKIEKEERRYVLRLLGYKNLPKTVPPFQYSVLVASSCAAGNNSVLSYMPQHLYNQLDPRTGSLNRGGDLPPFLRDRAIDLVKWLNQATIHSRRKTVNYNFRSRGRHGTRRGTIDNVDSNFFVNKFEKYLQSITRHWMSHDGMCACKSEVVVDSNGRQKGISFWLENITTSDDIFDVSDEQGSSDEHGTDFGEDPSSGSEDTDSQDGSDPSGGNGAQSPNQDGSQDSSDPTSGNGSQTHNQNDRQTPTGNSGGESNGEYHHSVDNSEEFGIQVRNISNGGG